MDLLRVFLLGCAPLFPGGDQLLTCLALAFLCIAVVSTRCSTVTNVDLLIVAFVFEASGSALHSREPYEAFVSLSPILTSLLLFFCYRLLTIKSLYLTCMWSSTLVSVAGLFHFLRTSHVVHNLHAGSLYELRAYVTTRTELGSYQHPVGLVLAASFIVFALPKRTVWQWVWVISGCLLFSAYIFCCFSRGAYVAEAGGVTTWFLLQIRARYLKVGVLSVALALIFAVTHVAIQHSDIASTLGLELTQSQQRSDKGREGTYREAIAAFRVKPLWLGAGPGSFARFTRGRKRQTFNVILQVLYEEGVLGIILLVGFFAAVTNSFLRIPQTAVGASAFVGAAMVAVVIYSMFWSSLLFDPIAAGGIMYPAILLQELRTS